MRKTKIVATLGPASSSNEIIRSLIQQGVDVFRMNFSHGTHAGHRENMRAIRNVSAELNTEVAIMQDLCGPKIRTGLMKNGAITLEDNKEITITNVETVGTPEIISCSYPHLEHDLKSGARVLLDDGRLELQVTRAVPDGIACRVIHGGTLKNNKGINFPDSSLSTPSVTEKDMADLLVGIEENVDFVALSFVRKPEDIQKVKSALKGKNCPAQVIAKIEKPEAIANLDAIIAEADGVLVARGDLGVEMDLAEVPLLQKDIIQRANEQDKYVIVATQMLESMISNSTPTRAEVADIANAILDGADAVMLSGETAIGAFPVESVKIMDRICRKTEEHLLSHPPAWNWMRINEINPIQDAIGHAVSHLCKDLNPGAIVTFSPSGGTALFLSKSRPMTPIIAFTGNESACHRMRLFWGVTPVVDKTIDSKAKLRDAAKEYIRTRLEANTLLMVAGTHFGLVGSANEIEIFTPRN